MGKTQGIVRARAVAPKSGTSTSRRSHVIAALLFVAFDFCLPASVQAAVTIGGNTYEIPPGYLSTPLSEGDTSFLIRAELPDMKTTSHNQSGGWGKRVLILAHDEQHTTDVFHRLKSAIQMYGPINLLDMRYGLSHYRGAKEVLGSTSSYRDIFIEQDNGPVFADCNGDKSVPHPSCTMTFAASRFVFEVTMAKDQLKNWKAIRRDVTHLVRSFRTNKNSVLTQ